MHSILATRSIPRSEMRTFPGDSDERLTQTQPRQCRPSRSGGCHCFQNDILRFLDNLRKSVRFVQRSSHPGQWNFLSSHSYRCRSAQCARSRCSAVVFQSGLVCVCLFLPRFAAVDTWFRFVPEELRRQCPASNRWEVIATMRDRAKETELNKLTGAALLAFDITDHKQ